MTSPAELANQVRDALDESMRMGARQSARLIRLTKEGQAALSVLEERLEQAEKALEDIARAAQEFDEHIRLNGGCHEGCPEHYALRAALEAGSTTP